jgi:hypothetical protein
MTGRTACTKDDVIDGIVDESVHQTMKLELAINVG